MRRAALLLALAALVPACGPGHDAVAAYDSGDAERAHEILHDLDAGAVGDAAPWLLHDHALTALAVGDLADARDAAERLAVHDDPAEAARGRFLLGNALHALAERAAAQARAVESEPFAFEIAIRHAEDAARSWCGAAAARGEWPAAARNAERALRLAETLRREQRDAAARRDRKTAGAGTPRVRPIPVDTGGDGPGGDDPSGQQPPPVEPGDAAAAGEAAGVTESTLSAADVAGLLERLAAREREKRDVREERRRAAGGVERDW